MIHKNQLQTQVYDHLKENILNGTLKNNTLYSATKIAAELGISRTPIQEALHYLSQDGYINIIPSKGFMIHQLSENDIRETIQIRCAIEGFCTHIVSSEIKSEKAQKLLKELTHYLELQEKTMAQKTTHKEFMEYDHQFHLALVNYTECKEFNSIFQRSMYQIHLTTSTTLTFPNRLEDTFNEHKNFLTHLKSGDGDSAYKILINHLMMPLNMNILNNSDNITKF